MRRTIITIDGRLCSLLLALHHGVSFAAFVWRWLRCLKLWLQPLWCLILFWRWLWTLLW